jgi:ABC-2 type transport system permease protein
MSAVGAVGRRAGARAYLAMARTMARSALTYRLSFVLTLFATMIQFLAMLAIWRVLLASGRSVGGFDWPQMKAYLLVGFICGVIVSQYADFRMAARIQDGMVSLDLTKPVDYQLGRFAEAIGGVWAELLSGGAVAALVLLISGGIPWPGPASALLFAASMLAVIPLKFLFVYLSSLTCFYTQNYLGVHWARLAVVSLFSGALVPLAYFPGWLQGVARVLPFSSVASTPALIFLGKVSTTEAIRLISIQLVWIVALWFGARLIWRSAVRRLTVHGG